MAANNMKMIKSTVYLEDVEVVSIGINMTENVTNRELDAYNMKKIRNKSANNVHKIIQE